MQTQTLGSHRNTYDAIFQHPISHNLQWREVRALLDHLCDAVDEESSGHVKFTRNGETLIVHPPRHKDFSDVAEVMRIRHFLERSDDPAPPTATAAAAGDGRLLLVVIDHRQARLFRAELHGSAPQRITLVDPHGWDRYLHNVGAGDIGKRKPELKAFYEGIAGELAAAEQILVLGTATGTSSAMDHLVAHLKQHHPAIAKRIVGTAVIDEKHMTDDQLLAQARAFFVTAPQPH